MTSPIDTALAARLRGAGLRLTQTTHGILQLLARQGRPVSAATLRTALRPSPAATTVYRLLERLVRAGVVARVEIGHGHVDYELALDGAHHHATCTSCGRVEQLHGCTVAPLVRAATQHAGFASITRHTIELFGTCKDCAAIKP